MYPASAIPASSLRRTLQRSVPRSAINRALIFPAEITPIRLQVHRQYALHVWQLVCS